MRQAIFVASCYLYIVVCCLLVDFTTKNFMHLPNCQTPVVIDRRNIIFKTRTTRIIFPLSMIYSVQSYNFRTDYIFLTNNLFIRTMSILLPTNIIPDPLFP